ncbi:MAG TPA: ABC transporter substrate-binding protein [Phycisphaerae bacterium]|nr:ABC transporter substrate-binding protein [Phycisphaerae bacterium]
MKYVFVFCALALVAAGTLTKLTEPDARSPVPVVYWATDPNPARIEQIRLLHEWLVKNGYTTPEGKPAIELRLDTVNFDSSKLIVQGVSGVAADIWDRGVPDLENYSLLADVTEDARRLGFDTSHTYPALADMLSVDGKQYGFPCNVYVVNFWGNADTFAKYGMKPPPRSWDIETFERIGKEFVGKANPPGQRRTVFFTSAANATLLRVLARSEGLDQFNETLTKCILDDERFARALAMGYKWTYEDHILPSAADESSFATQAGYGGTHLSLFQQGNYGMIMIGRYMLIRLRDFASPPRLFLSHLPYVEFENTFIGTRAAGIYAGSSRKKESAWFLAFLASKEYNDNIVADADSLPPDPAATTTEAFLHPPEHPNEWGTHEAAARSAQTIAIVESRSPFIEPTSVGRIVNVRIQEVMTGRATPAQAAKDIAERVNEEIQRPLAESPSLRARYEELTALQEKIDQYRREGKRVPLDWIKNPFYRRYYVHKGWAQEN